MMPAPLDPESPVALSDLFDRLRRNIAAFGDRFPTVGDGTQYQLTANDHWLAGFWTGLLWLAYAATHDDVFKAKAIALLPSFEKRLDEHIHVNHDLGFLFTLSARAQWQLTGDDAAHALALRAAEELLQRYNARGRYLPAWGEIGDPQESGRIIIDSLLNMPLLFWASEELRDPRYRIIARRQAEVSAEYLMREDASSNHTFFLDPATGQPIGPKTHQGYSDTSMWARGQAWAIDGFAIAAEWSGEQPFRDMAYRAAKRFLAELPPDGIPRWDLRLPDDAPQYFDTSAGAIAACGMLRLARQLEGDDSADLHQAALILLDNMSEKFWDKRPDVQGLLGGGTYHVHKQLGVNTFFICGDYYYLEALLMLDDSAPDFWGRIPARV